MVDVVHFDVGVESRLPDFNKIYKGVFPKENTFKPTGTRVEKHLDTFLNKFPTTSEVLLKSIIPNFMKETVTRPLDYSILMRNVMVNFKNLNLDKMNRTSSQYKNYRRASRVLKKMKSDTNLLFIYLTNQIYA